MRFRKTPRLLILTAVYVAFVNLAVVAALWLRFEGIPAREWDVYVRVAPLHTVLSLVGFLAAGLFHGLWRYAGTATMLQVLQGVTLSALALAAINLVAPGPRFPWSVIVMAWFCQLLLVGGARFAWQASRDRVPRRARRATRTLVVSAHSNAVHLIQEMRHRPAGAERLVPVGILDDDARLTGRLVEGVQVRGTLADLARVVAARRAELVIVADPNLAARSVRQVAQACAEAGVRIKTLPGLSDLHPGRPSLALIRDVRIEDLLGREPVELDLDEVAGFIRGKRVLVTGAGGSIGAELARQAAGFGPRELVLLDRSENGLYYVHDELVASHPRVPVTPVVGDVRDDHGMESLLARHKPELVLHAAAHKHVPLLEGNPREAVFNNIVGTRVLVEAADRHGVDKFVLVSTDKAVNPTSVMGASKRVCEMIGQSRSRHGRTRFVAVRFGNVLGSEGSVVPLFRRQLERGGPITVTHPDARRYFMTMSEAVRLVLQAGAMGRGGEVFLLDMGEQVRILDLARQLIRLAGLREGDDVEIKFIGLRPGEKLSEELHSDAERTRITRHERILVLDLDPHDEGDLLAQIDGLVELARVGDAEAIKRALHLLVPEYHERPPVPEETTPEDPVVERPGAEAPSTPWPGARWREAARHALDPPVAGMLLGVTAPLWAALWVEARLRGERDSLVRGVAVGRTRRAGERRDVRLAVPVDRRGGERRARDRMGLPFEVARFRTDLGPVSRWLGRRGLDRLPWLLNVLRNEMALVGPAPETADLGLRRKGLVPDYARRFTVLPGVTGLAQIMECGDDGAEGAVRRANYDLYYVDNHSWLLDARILGRTLGIVLKGPGRAGPSKGGTVAPGAEGPRGSVPTAEGPPR